MRNAFRCPPLPGSVQAGAAESVGGVGRRGWPTTRRHWGPEASRSGFIGRQDRCSRASAFTPAAGRGGRTAYRSRWSGGADRSWRNGGRAHRSGPDGGASDRSGQGRRRVDQPWQGRGRADRSWKGRRRADRSWKEGGRGNQPRRDGGGAVEARTTSSTGGSLAGGSSASGFSMACTRSLSPSCAAASNGWRTVVSGRGDVGGDGDVVEADDADVLRHPAAGLPQRADQADGHVVVRGEHRGHGAVGGQLAARRVAGSGRPVALDDGRFVRAPCRERRPPALDTVPWRRTTAADRRGDGRSRVPDPAGARWPPAPARRRRPRGQRPGGGEGRRCAEEQDRHVDADCSRRPSRSVRR